MAQLKIGVRLEALGLPLRRGLEAANRLGIGGVRVDAVGDLAPQQLSQTGRREFRNLLRAWDLELTAIHCPLRRGLNVAENLEPRIEHIRQVMQLSFDLGPRLVTVQAGRVPDSPTDPGYPLLREALLDLSRHGDRIGVILALETGLEPASALKDFLDPFDTGSLGINLDPANLLMNGFDPYDSAAVLRERLVHCHAKDARAAGASRSAQEVPLGHGDIDWMRFLACLAEADYHGWLTITRETGGGVAEIEAAVRFLRRFVG
ncbi:MAG: sugar phosphate isomerase/epimerase family protein [Gemmataceae bacterium]